MRIVKKILIINIFIFCLANISQAEEIIYKYKNHNTIRKINITAEKVNETVEYLNNKEHIEIAEKNMQRSIFVLPNDEYFNDQWYLYNGEDTDIDGGKSWNTETGSSETIIAVIDTGVDLDHEDLKNNIWINDDEIANNGIDDDNNGYIDDMSGWDFVYNNNDPNPNPDGQGSDGGVSHGTHVAGIIAAEANNEIGVAGVCWNCRIMAVQVMNDEGIGEVDNIYDGIVYAAENGADVINLSFGSYDYSEVEKAAIDIARDHSVVIVAAAGNNSKSINKNPIYPACNKGVLGVAATDINDNRASFSNYGADCVDVSAPGDNIASTLYTDDGAYGFTTDYGYMSGTSMATPVVAGIAGLLRSYIPELPKKETANYIKDGCEKKDLADNMGHGRVNAKNSLEQAADYFRPERPETINGYTGKKKGHVIEAKTDTNETSPYFTWSKAETTLGEITGYYVYWGTNKDANPKKKGEFQTSRKFSASKKNKIKANEEDIYYLIIKSKNSYNKVSEDSKKFKYYYSPE